MCLCSLIVRAVGPIPLRAMQQRMDRTARTISEHKHTIDRLYMNIDGLTPEDQAAAIDEQWSTMLTLARQALGKTALDRSKPVVPAPAVGAR